MTHQPKPRVLIISLGGTWSMQKESRTNSNGDDSRCLAPGSFGEGFALTDDLSALEEFCIPAFHELLNEDSTNLRHPHWQELAEFIGQEAMCYDAFVVLQGTDTMSYAAAAMAFALRGLGKPIVFTGAQLCKDVPGSDASANMINAARVAGLVEGQNGSYGSVLREVAVVFGSRIIRASRCRKSSEEALEAFDSVNAPLLGRIGVEIRIDAAMRLPRVRTEGTHHFRPAAEFDEAVNLLTIYPGMRPGILAAIGRQSRGVVLAAFGAGNIPCSTRRQLNHCGLEPELDALRKNDIPVVVTTQCSSGQAEPGMYETGEAAQRAGAIICRDMSSEAAFIKLSWLLANEDRWPEAAQEALRCGRRLEGIRIAMLEELVGEIGDDALRYSREPVAFEISDPDVESEAA